MALSIERVEVLLLIAAVVAILARRLRMPYTVGLVIAGGALALTRIGPRVELTRELIYTAFLPPLVFEAALYIPWPKLRRDLPVVVVLAALGVLLSAALTSAGMHYIAGWKPMAALLFGFLIAATDPVSVIATFRETGVRGRLALLVESESLLNDGTAAVAFGVALSVATGASMTLFELIQTSIAVVLGGIVCGALVAGGILLLAGRTEDPLVEITFTTVAAYGSFLLAEHFHLSGVLATLTAGLLVGNIGPLRAISARGREAVESFWQYVAFVANSLVFLLIGMREAQEKFLHVWALIALAIALVIVGRAVAVYSCCRLFARTALKVDMRYQHVLVWGGLRGALALALALSLPDTIPMRSAITLLAFAVVAFSVIVQGLTIAPLMRRLGILPADQAHETIE